MKILKILHKNCSKLSNTSLLENSLERYFLLLVPPSSLVTWQVRGEGATPSSQDIGDHSAHAPHCLLPALLWLGVLQSPHLEDGRVHDAVQLTRALSDRDLVEVNFIQRGELKAFRRTHLASKTLMMSLAMLQLLCKQLSLE